jgi:hypothetical protein
MRHVLLTCTNHPNLRWMCKEVAVNNVGAYNGSRNIFFNGPKEGAYESECSCSASLLRFAPEELELQKTQPLERYG